MLVCTSPHRSQAQHPTIPTPYTAFGLEMSFKCVCIVVLEEAKYWVIQLIYRLEESQTLDILEGKQGISLLLVPGLAQAWDFQGCFLVVLEGF